MFILQLIRVLITRASGIIQNVPKRDRDWLFGNKIRCAELRLASIIAVIFRAYCFKYCECENTSIGSEMTVLHAMG
jgi:hypothetical protein